MSKLFTCVAAPPSFSKSMLKATLMMVQQQGSCLLAWLAAVVGFCAAVELVAQDIAIPSTVAIMYSSNHLL